jgi:hypothetical protein
MQRLIDRFGRTGPRAGTAQPDRVQARGRPPTRSSQDARGRHHHGEQHRRARGRGAQGRGQRRQGPRGCCVAPRRRAAPPRPTARRRPPPGTRARRGRPPPGRRPRPGRRASGARVRRIAAIPCDPRSSGAEMDSRRPPGTGR